VRVLGEYLPVLVFLVVAAGIGVVLLVLGALLGPKRSGPDADKLSPYECGFEAFEDARMRFDVRYYLVAILFIAFDLEIAFVFPWAVIFRDLGVVGLVEMGIFLGLLVLGFVYVWKKGALEWE
jgi:NADH-quinone oxidoreductase subunit A